MPKPAPSDTSTAARRAEIEFELQWLDVSDAYYRAKETLPRDSAEFLAAKKAFGDMRTFWRGVREFYSPDIAHVTES
jgi:hypothetical protein